MKTLFTADLHIKLGQKNVPIDWSINRFNLFIDQLSDMQNKADTLVLGGDIFDRVPTTAELELYFRLISSITIPCVIYPGNHEALKKNTTFLTHLKEVTTSINSKAVIIDKCCTMYGLDFIPYNHLKDKEWPEPTSKVLCTHVRGEIPPHVKPEIDLTKLDGWDIVLAGDLHSHTNSQRNIVYPGSPYTTSFHRQEVETYAILLDQEEMNTELLEFRLPQLIRKTIKYNESMEPHPFHNIIYELEGSLAELASVESSELLDKKISTAIKDSALMLGSDMTIVEEVKEYLEFILDLNPEEVNSTIHELKSHSGRIDI